MLGALLIQGVCIYAAATTTELPFIASLIFFGICYGASAPLLLVILMDLPQVGAKVVGVASGLFYSIGAIGGFVGPLFVGFLRVYRNDPDGNDYISCTT